MARIKLNNGYENTWSRARAIIISKWEPGRHAVKLQLKSHWQVCDVGQVALICGDEKQNHSEGCHKDEVRSMQSMYPPLKLQDPNAIDAHQPQV